MDEAQKQARTLVSSLVEQTGLSLTELAREAGVAASTLTRFMANTGPDSDGSVKHTLSARTQMKLVEAAARITKGKASLGTAFPSSLSPFDTIQVRGAVQAGVWRESIEWPHTDWQNLTVPRDGRFAYAERFGLVVRGESMNRLYPDGTIVIVVRFADLGRAPRPGERVVVLRRSTTGEYEATLKDYELDAKGRHVLWPRSTEPEFQEPIILTDAPIGDGLEAFPPLARAGSVELGDLESDIVVAGLVVGSYRIE